MRIDPTVGRRLVLAATAAGLAARLTFGLLYWVHKPMTHDEREYLALAQSLASGHGFSYEADRESGTTQQFGRAPGYPLFLAAIGAAGGPSDSVPGRVKVVQSIIGAFTVCVIAALAWRLAGPPAGAVSAWIAAVYPPLVWISAYALSESVYCLLGMAAVLMLDGAVDRAESRRLATRWSIAAGAVTGAAILVRPAMLFFVPIAALWLVARRQYRVAVLLALTSLLVVAPWTARNYRAYGRFVLVASEGGVTFWTGNHPLARGEGDLAANPDIKLAEIEFRQKHPGLTAEQLEPLYYREALDYIVQHPWWWAALLVRKAFFTVVPIGPSYTLHSTLYAAASIASYLLLVPFAIAGARVYRGHGKARRPEALFLLAASAAIVSVLFFPQERFRIPVIDPTLIVCAGLLVGDRS